jgi:hypothetical protein
MKYRPVLNTILKLSKCCIVTISAAASFLSCAIGDGDALSQLSVDDPLFLATGTGGSCYASMDGILWRYVGTTSSDNFSSTYNNGTYLIGGRTGTDIYAAESIDLAHWQGATTGTEGAVVRIVYQHSMVLMAVADNNPGIYRYQGGTITQVLLNGALDMYCITFGDGLFIAGGAGGTLFTSIDGSTWSQVSEIPGNYAVHDAIYAQGLFVLTGRVTSGFGQSLIIISSKGTHGYSANLYSGTVTNQIGDITYGNGRFVAASGSNEIWCSDDGYRWSYLQVPQLAGGFINDITYGNGLYVLVTTAGHIYCSKDGIAWMQTFSSGTPLYTVTCRP